jgi:hypothetical protein
LRWTSSLLYELFEAVAARRSISGLRAFIVTSSTSVAPLDDVREDAGVEKSSFPSAFAPARRFPVAGS